MSIALTAFIVLITVLVMEGWAWWVHKYILHGPLWFIHQTHHRPRTSWWEANDIISIIYGFISAVLIIYGDLAGNRIAFAIGIGIAIYGILYLVLHDVLIHQRVKWRFKPQSPYLQRLIRAHKLHHKHMNQKGSAFFGFLYSKPIQ